MNFRAIWLAVFTAAFLSVFTCNLAAAEDQPAVDFSHDIAPLIKARCGECHTDGAHKGSLSLDTRESAIASKVVTFGASTKSLLIKRVLSLDPDERMPPKGDRLKPEEVQKLKAWIDGGLTWESGFTFKTDSYRPPLQPRRPELPPARSGLEHPIDRILSVYYGEHKVKPPAPLDDVAFIRRAYLDVLGLLPPRAELVAFVADKSSEKHARLIAALLADRPSYAGHWLTFWNDLLRNDYSGTGYIDGGRKQITGWLYQSLLDNKPYDKFVRELISASPKTEGFMNGIKWRGRVNASQTPEIQFSQNVSQVFFGINMKCASCHDSFIDHWKLDEAYGLAAVVADAPLEIYRCDKATGKMAEARFLWPELGTIDSQAPKAKRLKQLADLMTHPNNGRLNRTLANRIWQRLMGRGIVEPVDVMGNRPWSGDLLDYLGVYLTEHDYDVQALIEHIASSRAYGSQAVIEKQQPEESSFVFRGPQLKRMTAEQFVDSVWALTGAAPTTTAAKIELSKSAVGRPPVVRAALEQADALMLSLGRPNREQVVTTRGDTLTTLQALDLSNGQILSSTLARGADNLLKGHAVEQEDTLIESIYLAALSRRPTTGELTDSREILGAKPNSESLADLLWVVIMLPEFQLIR